MRASITSNCSLNVWPKSVDSKVERCCVFKLQMDRLDATVFGFKLAQASQLQSFEVRGSSSRFEFGISWTLCLWCSLPKFEALPSVANFPDNMRVLVNELPPPTNQREVKKSSASCWWSSWKFRHCKSALNYYSQAPQATQAILKKNKNIRLRHQCWMWLEHDCNPIFLQLTEYILRKIDGKLRKNSCEMRRWETWKCWREFLPGTSECWSTPLLPRFSFSSREFPFWNKNTRR